MESYQVVHKADMHGKRPGRSRETELGYLEKFSRRLNLAAPSFRIFNPGRKPVRGSRRPETGACQSERQGNGSDQSMCMW